MLIRINNAFECFYLVNAIVTSCVFNISQLIPVVSATEYYCETVTVGNSGIRLLYVKLCSSRCCYSCRIVVKLELHYKHTENYKLGSKNVRYSEIMCLLIFIKIETAIICKMLSYSVQLEITLNINDGNI